MADSPLNQQVFQVPKLGQLGMQLDQANEKKRAAQQKKLQDVVEKTGADDAYMKSINTLTADWRGVAEDQYDIYRSAAIEYEQTGSESAKRAMQYQAGLLNHALTAGETILSTAGENFTEAKAANFDGYSVGAEEASKGYASFINQKIERKKTPQGVMIKEGDSWVPMQNSSYFSSQLTENNTYLVPKSIKTGKYANTTAFVDKWSGIISKSESEQEAVNRVLKEMDIMYEKDESFLLDTHIFHGINDRSIGSYDKFGSNDLQEITSTLDNEVVSQDAYNSYKEAVVRDVKARWFAGKETDSTSGDGFGALDVRVIKKENIQADDIRIKGEKVAATRGKNATSVTFDAYTGLPSGVKPSLFFEREGVTKGANSYQIVGIGVIDGVPYAQKQTYDVVDFNEAVNNEFSGYDSKGVVIEPLTRAEFTRIKAKGQDALMTRFAEAGQDISDWFSGNSVSSQEENSEESSTETNTDSKKAEELRNKYNY